MSNYKDTDTKCAHCGGKLAKHLVGTENFMIWCDDCGGNNPDVPPKTTLVFSDAPKDSIYNKDGTFSFVLGPKDTNSELSASERWDYERLKVLEVRGLEEYQEMRKAPTLSEDAVLSFINQLSPWNLKTSGANILQLYIHKSLLAVGERIIGEDEDANYQPVPGATGFSIEATARNELRAEQRQALLREAGGPHDQKKT